MQSLLFSFQGRVNRAKFWLISLGVLIVEMILFGVLGGGAMMSGDTPSLSSFGAMGIVAVLVLMVAVWISLAVAVKRWHDRGKSGWWMLIAFVPVIGGLWYIVECGFLKGTTGANAYGSDPLSSV